MENVAKGILSYFFSFFFSSEMFHKLAGHRSHREMPSRLKDIYLLVNGRKIFFFSISLHEKDETIYIYGLMEKRNKIVLILWIFLYFAQFPKIFFTIT